MSNMAFMSPASYAETISPEHKMTIPCDQMMDTGSIPIKKATMDIIVTYRPDFVPWRRTTKFPMEAQKRLDSTWLWRHLPN